MENHAPIGFIISSSGFSKESENTPEMIEYRQKAIVDVVWSVDEVKLKKAYWNKLFYDNLAMHHVIKKDEYELIKGILSYDGDFSQNSPIIWCKDLSIDTYNLLFDALAIEYSRFETIENLNTKKFLLKFNEKFWNIKKMKKSNVLNDILNQKIYPFEQFYDDRNVAIENGLILTTAICVFHDSENSYYYAQKVKEQLKLEADSIQSKLSKYGIEYNNLMPVFKFNMMASIEEERMKQYELIKNNEQNLLNFYKELYSMLYQKPFEIIEIQ